MAAAYAQWRDPASRCRGALAWFLRDLRAGAGWGVLDELGHPKAAFHALARAWQPLHAGLVDDGQNGAFAYVLNERGEAFDGRVELAFFARGEVPVGRVERPLALPPHGAWRESVLAHAPGFLDLNGSYRFGPAAADVLVATVRDAAGAVRAQAIAFLAPPPLARADIGLAASARRLGDAAGTVRVMLRARAAARGVHFEAPGWRASDEYFALAPGAQRTVDLAPVRDDAACATPPWVARAGAINASAWTPVPLAEDA
jgi:beta-mannosidase